MISERARSTINYAIWAEKNPDNRIIIGSGHPEIFLPVITKETIKGGISLLGALFKGSGAFVLALSPIHFFNAGKALSEQDYALALGWAASGLQNTGVAAGIIGASHWAQTKVAPEQNAVETKTKNKIYHFGDYFYSGYISQDKQFPYNDTVRRFLPRFIRKGMDQSEVRKELIGMQVFDLENHGLHERGRN